MQSSAYSMIRNRRIHRHENAWLYSHWSVSAPARPVRDVVLKPARIPAVTRAGITVVTPLLMTTPAPWVPRPCARRWRTPR